MLLKLCCGKGTEKIDSARFSVKKIRISLKKRSHDILIGYGLIRDYGLILKGLDIGKDAVVVTNRRLLDLYGEP